MVYRFTDVVIDSRTGLNPRKNFVLGGGDNYYITIKDIYNGKVNLTDKTDKVDDEAIQIIKRRSRIKAGDVLFVSIGRIGETAIVTNKDDSWDVNESVFVFTLNDKIITPEYFCTMFQSQGVKQYLSGNSSGSTFKSIKMNQLERMTFDLPPVTTQKSITTKLTAVRRIIDLRTSQLAELNNLVKARFIELFGDPDENPMKWETTELDQHLDIVGGFAFKSDGFADTGIPVLRIGNINSGHFLPVNMVFWPDDPMLARYKMYPGDLVMSLTGTVGKDDYGNVCILSDEYSEYYLNQRNAKLAIKATLNKHYLSEMLKFSKIKKRLTGISRGVRQANISNKDILALCVPIPPITLQEQFAAFVEQTDKSKVVVQKALDEAQTLFDSLMQEYFG